MFRSLLSYIFVREFLVQDVLYLQNPQRTSGPSWSVRLLAAPRSMGPAVFLGSPPTHSFLKSVSTNCESHLQHNDLDTKMPTIQQFITGGYENSLHQTKPQTDENTFTRVAKRTSVTRNNRRGPRPTHGETGRQPQAPLQDQTLWAEQ